jgi:hypothetical protein
MLGLFQTSVVAGGCGAGGAGGVPGICGALGTVGIPGTCGSLGSADGIPGICGSLGAAGIPGICGSLGAADGIPGTCGGAGAAGIPGTCGSLGAADGIPGTCGGAGGASCGMTNRFPSTWKPWRTLLPRSSTFTPGTCGCPGRLGGDRPGIWGMPGFGGAGVGAGLIVAVFFAWSSMIVCAVAGLQITDVLPESTRVLPSAERENWYVD